MKEVVGDRVCRAVRVITSSLGDGHIRFNGLAKVMEEKIDWEENAARKIADAELSIEIESKNCGAKWRLGASVLEHTVPMRWLMPRRVCSTSLRSGSTS